MRCRLLFASLLVALSGCVGPSTASRAPSAPAPRLSSPDLHPVMMAYTATLEGWLDAAEIQALASTDLHGTQDGDAQRLRYMAADRVVRLLLPQALEAQGRPELVAHAERLRALPPLLNPDTDAVAAPAVRAAMRALSAPSAAAAAEAAEMTPEELLRLYQSEAGRAPTDSLAEATGGRAAARRPADAQEALAEAEFAAAMAEYADTYARARGVSALRADAAAAAAADTVGAGLLFRVAVEEWGVPRSVVVDAASELLADMAEAARRRERIPYIPRPADPRIDRPTSSAAGLGP